MSSPNLGKIYTPANEVRNLESHQPLWNKLAFHSRRQDPFSCSSIWQMSFHAAFSPKRRLLIRESADSLVTFAEKVFSRNDIFLTPIEAMWFFGDNILGPHALDLLADTLIDIEKFYAPIFPKLVI